MFFTIRILLALADVATAVLLTATAEHEAKRRGGCRNKEFDSFARVFAALMVGNVILLMKGLVWG